MAALPSGCLLAVSPAFSWPCGMHLSRCFDALVQVSTAGQERSSSEATVLTALTRPTQRKVPQYALSAQAHKAKGRTHRKLRAAPRRRR